MELEGLSLVDLRNLAKDKGISNVSKLKKSELIEKIMENYNNKNTQKNEEVSENKPKTEEVQNLEVNIEGIEFTTNELEGLNLTISEVECLMPFIKE